MYRSDKKNSVLFFIEIFTVENCAFLKSLSICSWQSIPHLKHFVFIKSRCNTIDNIIFRAFSGKERYNSRLGSTQQHLYHMGQVLFNSLKVDWQWSGHDAIKLHILSQKPNGEGTQTVKTQNKTTQEESQEDSCFPADGLQAILIKMRVNLDKQKVD